MGLKLLTGEVKKMLEDDPNLRSLWSELTHAPPPGPGPAESPLAFSR